MILINNIFELCKLVIYLYKQWILRKIDLKFRMTQQ